MSSTDQVQNKFGDLLSSIQTIIEDNTRAVSKTTKYRKRVTTVEDRLTQCEKDLVEAKNNISLITLYLKAIDEYCENICAISTKITENIVANSIAVKKNEKKE